MNKEREAWPDVLRGISVFFVVLVHIRFFASAALGYVPTWALTFSAGAAPFYLPALFFVSGYFVPLSLRRGRRSFIWIKVLTIAWPLFLWNIFNTWRGMDLTSVSDILRVSYLWFLLYLFIYNVIAALVKGIPSLIPLIVSFVLPIVCDSPSFMDLDRVFDFAPYFFAGIVAAKWRTSIVSWAMKAPAMIFVVAGIGACIWSARPGSITAPLIQVLSLTAISGAVVVSIWISQSVPCFCSIFSWLGTHSLELYVLHWQIGLLIAPLWPHFSHAGTAFLIIGCSVMLLSCAASWLFKLPVLRYTFSLRR